MFQLHERTRLLLCRTGFLLLCLAPTLFVGGAAVHYRSGSYLEARREEWTAVLSDKLGLEVRMARLSYPLWNTALLEEVILADPETGEAVASARYVEVALEEGRWHVKAGQPEVSAESLTLLRDLLHDRLLRGHALNLAPLEFEAGELTFRSGTAAQTFHEVRAELLTTDTGKRASAAFQIVGVASEKPLEVSVERQRGSGSAKTTCQLNTHGALVPVGALVPLWPWLKQLGDEATFEGTASVEQATEAAEPATSVSGRLRDLDLARLVAANFPHHELTGWVDVELAPLRLQGTKIVELGGTAEVRQGGSIGWDLLLAMQEHLDLSPADPPQLPARPRVRYRNLAFGFRLDQEGLRLSGDADQEGMIMASSAGVLLEASDTSVVPATYLIDLLSPRSEVQIPATSEARSLLEILPLPLTRPTTNGLPRAERIRLRGSE